MFCLLRKLLAPKFASKNFTEKRWGGTLSQNPRKREEEQSTTTISWDFKKNSFRKFEEQHYKTLLGYI